MSRIAPTPIAALFLVAAAACNDSGTNSGPRITVTPSTLTLNVGASDQLDAVLTAGAGTIVWSSGSPAVASVDQQGEVTGVSAGTATIRAEWQSNPAVFGTAVVTVNQTGVPITITSITRNGQSLNLSSLAGSFTVTMQADVAADFDGVAQVLLGGVVVGETEIVDGVATSVRADGAGSVRSRGSFEVKGSTYPVSVIGQDRIYKIPNSSQDFSTLIKTIPGVVVASGTGPSATVSNKVGVVVGLMGSAPDVIVDGRHYYGGDVNLQLIPVVPTGGTLTGISDIGFQLERIEVLKGPAGAVYGKKAIAGVVNFILSKDKETADTGIKNIGEGRFGVTRVDLIGATTDTATILNQYPLNGSLGAGFIHIDQRAPVIPVDSVTLEPGAPAVWLGFNTSVGRRFAQNGLRWRDTATATVVEEGSGIARCGLHVGTPGNFSATPIDSGKQFGSESATASWYGEYRCTDRIGFVATTELLTGPGGALQQIGFDYTAPSLQVFDTLAAIPGLIHRSVNPAAGTPVHFLVTDTPSPGGGSSGLDDETLEMLGILEFFGILPIDTCIDGLWKAEKNECKPLRLNHAIQFVPARIRDGEYRYLFNARDIAGNDSDLREIQILEDHVDPLVDNFVAPTALTAGVSWNTSFRIQDAVEVAGFGIGYRYTGITPILVYGFSKLSTPFDNQWLTTTTPAFGHRFPASAERLTLSGSFYKPEGIERRAADFAYGGYDQAGRVKFNLFNIGGLSTYNWTSFGAGLNGGDRYEFTASSYQVCYNPFGAKGNCNGIPESVQLNFDAYFPTGRVNTIEEMKLTKMSMIPGAEVATALTGAATVSRQTFGGFYIDRYTKTLNGIDLGPGNYRVGIAAFGPNHNVLLGIDPGFTKPLTVYQAKYQF